MKVVVTEHEVLHDVAIPAGVLPSLPEGLVFPRLKEEVARDLAALLNDGLRLRKVRRIAIADGLASDEVHFNCEVDEHTEGG